MVKGKLLLRILANSLLGVILVFVWSRFVNLEEVAGILQNFDLKLALAFLAVFFFSSTMRALRFKLMLKNYHLPLKDVVMLNILCQFLSFMIPIRAGEITKSAYLTSQFDLPLGKSIIWVFVDRFLDFWVVLLSISVFLGLVSNNLPTQSARLVFLLFLIFSLIFILSLISEQMFKRLVSFFSNFLVIGGVKKVFIRFAYTIIEGFTVLRRSPAELGLLIVLTILTLISDSLAWGVAFIALGANLGFTQAILGNSLAALTFLVPAAPGYVGSAEAAGLAVFGGILGFPANLVSAASIAFHILTLITLLVFGVLSLYFLKFDLNLVWKKIRKSD